MTDSDAPALPGAAPEPAPPAPSAAGPAPEAPAPEAPKSTSLGRRLGPILLILCGAVLVALVVGWLVGQRSQVADTASRAQITALQGQVAAGDARVATLTSAMHALAAQVTALSAQTHAMAQRPATTADPAVLAAVAALTKRVAALEARPSGGDTTALDAQVTALAKRLASVAQAGQDATRRLARIAAARAALDAGQPLGAIPGAPPALARFATTAPPTEAALREHFPAAADAALKASRPPQQAGIWARLKQRAQSLLTVRVDGRVVAGPPAAVPLDAARDHLDAGDLAGAVTALAPLDAAATHAMAGWTGDARALLAARAALGAMAAQGAAPAASNPG